MKRIKDSWAPLSATFMLTSIIGFLVSVFFIMNLSVSWGFSFAFLFVVMFIASFISMSKAEPIPDHMVHLAIHDHEKAYKPFVRMDKEHFGDARLKWYEPTLFLFFLVWFYLMYEFFFGLLEGVNAYLGLGFFFLGVAFSVYYLIDIFSKDYLLSWEQALFAILLIVSIGYGFAYLPVFGAGLFVYFLFRRKHWFFK